MTTRVGSFQLHQVGKFGLHLTPHLPAAYTPARSGWHRASGLFCPLAHLTDASYAVRVPRGRALPAASFPRHLAATQLLFG